jgi:hypothetical protein
MKVVTLTAWLLVLLLFDASGAADRLVIGNVSRTVEQLPNYAATDRGFSGYLRRCC